MFGRCQLLPQVLKATNGCFLCSATPKQARKDPFVMNLTNQLSLTETSNELLFIIILFVHFQNIFWRQIARQKAYSNWTKEILVFFLLKYAVLWLRISIFKTCTKKLFSVTYPSLTTDQNWIETLFANKSSSHELYLHKDWTWEWEHRIRVFQHLTVLYIYALRLYKNTAVSQSQLRLCVFSPDCKYCSL